MLYEEKDERFSVGVGRSRSKAFLFLEIGSLTTSEVHYLAADQPAGTWKIVAPRKDNHEYDVDHRGDQFFVRTNQGGRNFALAVAPVSDPSPAQWKTIVPHRADVMLQSALVFEGQTVLFERANGLPRFRVAKAGAEASDAWTALPFSEPAYTVSPASNPEFKTPTFRYAYQSFTTPQSVFDYDFATGQVDAAEGNGSARRLRPHEVHDRARDGDGAGRHEGAGLAGLPEDAGQERQQPDLPDRLRLLRHLRATSRSRRTASA